MTEKKKFHEYLYEVENWVDEFAIAFLSFGFIVAFIEILFFQSQSLTFTTLDEEIYRWVMMIGIMVIGRELWLMNRNIREYLEGE
jgi:hypothetical protein